MNEFRPESFSEYIGQKNIIENLKVCLESARIRGKCVDHIFLSGGSGVGKTSLAYLISKILKQKIYILNGPSLQKASDIISPLTALKNNEIIFIDEVHSASKEVFEILYPALEDRKLSIIIGKEYNSKIVNIKLPEFTLICATTEINKIIQPFVNRFPINFTFDNYTNEDISQIIKINVQKMNFNIDDEIANFISGFCKLNPRVAINLLKRINDYVVIEKPLSINIEFIKDTFKKMNLFKYGLTSLEIDYLIILWKNGCLGIESIQQIINMSQQLIITLIEPNLLKNNLIIKTARGRKLTSKGVSFLENFLNMNQ
ncbi:Holliday junction branch migration DNA helicase RuvB [Spiroplasma apis]|uniref:Holliday junction branch migration complex subunit RuvB n=1 Tax=Spiroplasma apis B31 TaxID=1276258 RepID=V5RKR0_SPIAP|nr:Holliday junction branch migration DNA helicase RuvB [Spiroplasma apis]AHB36400.1 Holliday junction DNA helicase RuvB [Spiroplasma apis B31]